MEDYDEDEEDELPVVEQYSAEIKEMIDELIAEAKNRKGDYIKNIDMEIRGTRTSYGSEVNHSDCINAVLVAFL